MCNTFFSQTQPVRIGPGSLAGGRGGVRYLARIFYEVLAGKSSGFSGILRVLLARKW